ncbi:hypothetical protein [Roseovarius sp. MMSF_3305]|uniref:hypothetical protein n=1 Tax=Roseovarius sp. MMSF_3305 TaxID=3046697 RepID=UPI00273D6386|nr:hypothetical protein [Roseovarius sp. MMSF_3305]
MNVETAKTVLAVTQDKELKLILEQALRKDRAYRYHECGSSKEALVRLESHEVNMLIFDADLGEDPKVGLPIKMRLSHPHVARMVVASPRNLAAADAL